MVVEKKVIGDVIVVDVKKNLMGGLETNECREMVKNLIAKGHKNLVINLSDAKRVNSMGLGMLMACYNLLRKSGGNMKIAGTSEKVNSLLTMTKLITIFERYKTIDLAIESFH